MKRLIAVLALTVLAFPAVASAMPDDLRGQQHGIRGGSLGIAPIQRTAPALAPQLPATGTDVAARDQQSPVGTSAPAPAPGGSGFDWADAGIGAGGMVALVAISIAAGVTFRRRRRTSLLAG